MWLFSLFRDENIHVCILHHMMHLFLVKTIKYTRSINKLQKKLFQLTKTILGAALLILTITLGINFLTLDNDHADASSKDSIVETLNKPVHSMNYKIGDEEDIENTVQAFETTYARESNYVKKEIDTIKAAERKEKEAAEKKAKAEKQAEETAANRTQESQNADQSTSQSTHTSSSSQGTASTTNTAQTQEASQPKAEQPKIQSASAQNPEPNTTTVQASEPKAAPAPSIGANKIGINGVYRNYSNYGNSTTERYQAGIDQGLIVAGITNFNGNDGQTTYFGGHNPGIMNFMANNIYNGAIVTVTDGSGQVFQYKMIDKVDVDEYGQGVLQTIGTSAINAYAYGTGSESILIHFCNTSNNLMSFWYGVQI